MPARKRKSKKARKAPAATQCAGTTTAGSQCARRPTHGEFCWWHSPDEAGKRSAALQKSWKKRHPPPAPTRQASSGNGQPPEARAVARLAGRVPATVADILELVAKTSKALVEGRISKTVAEVVIDGAKFQARLLEKLGKGNEDAAAIAAALGISVEEAAGMTQEDLGRELAKLRATALAPPPEELPS